MTSSKPDRHAKLSLPRSPILSSFNADWHHLHLASYEQPAYRLSEHCLSQHVICINAGKPVILHQQVDGQSKTIHSVPGDIGIYPAYLWQSFEWERDAAFLQLYLEPTVLTETARALDDNDRVELIPQLTSLRDPLIYQMAIALQTTLERDREGSQLYADSMAGALAAHLMSRYSTRKCQVRTEAQTLTRSQLSLIVDYVEAHLDRNLSLEELARVVHLSPYYFTRLFKQAVGAPPHRYHVQRRVARAKELLRTGSHSIADVASLVGFSSQGHLNYHFKRAVGMTPKQFLEQ